MTYASSLRPRCGAAILLLSVSMFGCADAGASPAPDTERHAPRIRQEAATGDSQDGDDDADSSDGDSGSSPVDAGTTASNATANASDAGAAVDPELEALRQLCVDEINRYRASVGQGPYARATDREDCSDRGAKLDGDSNRPHASASAGGWQGSSGYCPTSAQNACPGWGVGRGSGFSSVADALKGCLKMMWAEGPGGGHYMNMTSTRSRRVACGFYRMSNGKYWMNQNFW